MNETILLLALFFCHFLADYTHLSTKWMLDAKRLGTPLFPIFTHAIVHAQLMWLVIWIYWGFSFDYGAEIGGLYLFQLLSHFAIDIWKGRMNAWFPFLQSPANKGHWIMFGFDQFLHATVIILMFHYITSL